MPKPWKPSRKPSRKAVMEVLVKYEGSGDLCVGKKYLCDSCKHKESGMRRALIAADKVRQAEEAGR